MSRLVASQRAWLAPAWVREDLSRKAQALPSLDLRFAESKSLTDAASGANLVTFTRASSGTYVGSDGVLRTATTNLLLRSEEFETNWTLNGVTLSTNSTANPNGLVTADKLVENALAGEHNVTQGVTVLASTNYTLSCYAKKGERSFLALSPTQPGIANYYTWFDLNAGTIGTNTSGNTATITAVGNGWYRCTVSRATIAGQTSINAKIGAATGDFVSAYTGDGTSGIYLWGAQLEQSSTVGEYIPTTSTINSAPRFDHNPTTGESLGLLVEEQRTNLALWSQVIRLTEWPTQVASTSTINQAAAPDGTNTASTLIENTQTANHLIGQTMAVTNAAYTWSVFAKTKERRRILLRENSVSGAAAAFDVTTGTVVGTEAGATATITAYSNGWFKCSMTYTPSASSSRLHAIYLLPDSGTSFATSPYTGDNTSGIYLWGAQLEAGAFPTSYIPTTTATATRNADVASITGTNFSSWYRQDEGTVFADFNGTNIASGQFPRIFEFNDGTTNNLIRVQQYGANSVRVSVTNATVGQFAGDSGSVAVGVRGKTVFASAFNDAALVTNGASPTVDTAYLVPTGLTQIGIGASPGASTTGFNSTIRRLTFWPARLPNSTLQQITQ